MVGNSAGVPLGAKWLFIASLVVGCGSGPAEDKPTSTACPAGTTECGGQCLDVASNAQNCGACGTVCAPSQTCVGGTCQCQAGLLDCNGQCVNLQGDGDNCGTCGTACPNGQVCAAGACSADGCPLGQLQCDSSCVATETDPRNCGSCGMACAAPMICSVGTCVCPSGTTNCGGQCVDALSDLNNCGACGTPCSGGALCSSGACVGGGTGGGPATGGVGGTGGTGGLGTGGAGGDGTGGLGTGGAGGDGTGGTVVNPCPSVATAAYQGAPALVPGTVEAEDFDPSGYSDSSTGNDGGAYRTDVDVDIKALGAGYAIGWMVVGEWLEYTLNVPTAGDYSLSVRAGAVDAGRTLDFSQCGTPLGTAAVPQIATWGEMATANVGTVNLEAGVQVIRVTVGASDFVDFDSFTLGSVDPGTGGAGGASGTGGGGGDATGGSGAAGAATVGFVNNYDGARATTASLDSDWRFHLGDVSGAQNTTFDDSSWTALDVPHDWSISLPFNQSSAAGSGGGYLDGGLGWYRRAFSLPASSSGQRVIVQFDGVYMDSTVWLNGTQICARPYGYTSFECDFTTSASFGGTNVLAVRVNHQLPSSRWYSGSGIYRHVWLKTVNPVRIAYTGTRVTTPQVSATSATVNIAVSVQNDAATSQSVTVVNSVRDAAGTEVGTATSTAQTLDAGTTADVDQTVTVSNPALWSTTSPTLYSAVTTVSVNGATVDTYTTPFGIRTFAFDANTGFSLNGQRMKLNGVCLHHDLGSLGAAVNYRAMERRLELLKEMGANAVRTSHNPPAPEFLDLTDRLGFLVMDEAFDMWYGSKTQYDYARFFRAWGDTDIIDMVARDLNHPSVIMWSIGNEVPQAGDQAVVRQLMDAIRTKDTTRPIGQAFAAWSYDEGSAGLEDFVGLNYNPGIYDSQHASHPTWKLLGAETSSALRSRGIYNNNNTQCSSYDNNVAGWGQSAEASWQSVNTRDFIAGEFIWTGFDYIGEPTPYEWPAKSSYFGAIDTANFPKDIFYFYQSRWNYDGPTMVHIVPMDWTSWGAGQSVRVFAYSNADSVELLLNGSSLGSKPVDPAAGHLEWSVTFAAGTLEARATKGGAVVATDTVETAGPAARLVLKVDRTSISADGRDLAFVEVNVVDAEGVLVPQASNTITFTLEGPGTIAGVDNGNAISHESYQGNSRSAFSGKALAIIRSTATPGAVTLNAASTGLAGSSVVIVTGTP